MNKILLVHLVWHFLGFLLLQPYWWRSQLTEYIPEIIYLDVWCHTSLNWYNVFFLLFEDLWSKFTEDNEFDWSLKMYSLLHQHFTLEKLRPCLFLITHLHNKTYQPMNINLCSWYNLIKIRWKRTGIHWHKLNHRSSLSSSS